MRSTVLLSRLRISSKGRFVMALFAVPAILIGLLAMHVLTTGGMTEAGIVPVSASHHVSEVLAASGATDMAMVPSPGTPSPADDCGGPCMPSHQMLGMMCVLALLVTVILFTLQLLLGGWPTWKRVFVPLQVTAAALPAPKPPSLHVLSISRT